MLNDTAGWHVIAEVNPPELPDMSHLLLDGAWRHVLITDNVFGKIRVSPYAYAARITHDVPSVHPTVVVSTRDRNILAIESEVRGALGNGVNSFLVVVGDTLPAVEHLAHHYEIVEHLRELQSHMPAFEVGMPTRFRRWQYERRKDVGAEFFVAGPVLDPATVAPNLERLGRDPGDPPLYLMLIPPFGPGWVEQMEDVGAVPATEALRTRLAEYAQESRRKLAWEAALEAAEVARDGGCAGVIVMGLRFETVVDEGAEVWASLARHNDRH
jgi:5,10-methylenetetrahydrofolate reductase